MKPAKDPSPESDARTEQLLREAADMLALGEDAIVEFEMHMELGRFDLAWEALRTFAGEQDVPFGFWVTMSRAADEIAPGR